MQMVSLSLALGYHCLCYSCSILLGKSFKFSVLLRAEGPNGSQNGSGSHFCQNLGPFLLKVSQQSVNAAKYDFLVA
jgi:hypothetical protein